MLTDLSHRSPQRQVDSCVYRHVDTRPLSRCQSLSLSDMLLQGHERLAAEFDNSSIVSEPLFCMVSGRTYYLSYN